MRQLEIVPISLDEANAFVAEYHRHHKPVTGHKFSLAVSDGEKVCGVAIVGRPVSRMADDGWTLEVNRCATNGTRNACSMLYRSAWRAAVAIGYRRLITYTLAAEGGASLRGAGFTCLGQRGGGSWSRQERPRVDAHPTQKKLLWSVSIPLFSDEFYRARHNAAPPATNPTTDSEKSAQVIEVST